MDPEITELLSRLAELSQEELAELEERLREGFTEAAGEAASVERNALMAEYADAIDSVRAQVAANVEAAEALQVEADELAARVAGEAEAEEEPEVEAEDPPAEEPEGDPPAEEEPEADPEVPPVTAEEDPEEEPVEPPKAEKKAAKVTPISSLRQRVPARPAAPKTPGLKITSLANGRSLRNMSDVGGVLLDAMHRFGNMSVSGSESVPLVRLESEYPAAQRINNLDPEETARVLDQAIYSPEAQEAIVASGGICAPPTPYYDQAMISTADRPVRAGLASFQATRGGITFIPPDNLLTTGVEAATGVHTEPNDVDGATKACATFTCPSATTVTIQAVYYCAEFGNMGARTYPERVRAQTETVIANHARLAENELLNALGNNSTSVTGAQVLGVYRDWGEQVIRAAATFRSRHRMDPRAPLVVIAPFWAADMVLADMLRQIPGDVRDDEGMEFVNAFFARHGVRVIWTLDGVPVAGQANQQSYPPQGATALHQWSPVIVWYLFHPGTHLFLDGGTLDLGLVRDSTLNSTNDYQVFAETFEATAAVGIGPLEITSTVCATGETAGTVATDCATGS